MQSLSSFTAEPDRATSLRLNVALAFVIGAAIAVIWAEHSRYLFSWDSGNFALALTGIDIAAHRPHPPGYIGYVLAGRLLQPLTPTANAAFVLWNVIATMVAAVALSRLAAADGGAMRRVLAVAVLLCSPLLLFYASTAEIYVSEMAAILLIVTAAIAVIRGAVAPALLVVAFVVGAVFKLSSALFMLPMIGYALWTAPLTAQRRREAFVLAALGIVTTAAVFLALEPRLLSIVRDYFFDATSRSRVVVPSTSDLGRALNRNTRDTFIALLSAAGFNTLGAVGWLLQSRRAPFDRRLLWLWVLPWCVVLPFVHIGKPGYVLPIFPVLALPAADWYASRRTYGLVLASAASIANILWFTFAPPTIGPEDARPYHDKPLLARMASDLGPLTFPTVNTLRQSDREVADTLAEAASCKSGSWVVVAGSYRADWRRIMYYLPDATAVRQTDEGEFQFIGRHGMFSAIEGSETLSSTCGLLWTSTRPPALAGNAVPDSVATGWRLGPGAGEVSSTGLRWTVH